MPTYSYRCANCDFAFDQYQAFTDDSLTVCPNCGQPQLRKVFNSIGVTFNGSGFYRTDSRPKGGGDSTSGSSSSSSSSHGASAGNGGSKHKTDKPKADKAKAATSSAGASSSSSTSGSATR